MEFAGIVMVSVIARITGIDSGHEIVRMTAHRVMTNGSTRMMTVSELV
jgi:hypothetical protein